MQVEVTFLTRRGADALMRKTQAVTAEILRFGRGSDNEVSLPDIRVGLHAAELMQREGGLFIRPSGDLPLRINGAASTGGAAKLQDKIALGPYEIVIVEPPAEFDAAVTVELVQPLGDALERLVAENRIGLAAAGMNRRSWAWALFVVIALLGLALPVVVYPLGHTVTSSRNVPPVEAINYVNMSWNSGDISNSHRFFAQNCATCHRAAFASVPDAACLTCHANVGNHLDVHAELGNAPQELAATRCATCHEEHRGVHGLVIQADALCVGCHATLAQTAPKSDLRDVTSYPAGHPQFRATVVADAAKPSFVREQLEADPKPQDHSNLVFSHAAHLVPKGFLTPSGQKIMVCADCHVPEPSGQGFQAITFEGQCHSCHDLKFDAALPWREVPHGDAAGVKNAVQDFYARMALEGGVQDAAAPPLVRRAVGSPLPEPTETDRRDALAWAAQRANAAMGIIFDDKRGCTYCHVTDRANDAFTVAPVVLRTRFLPGAQFDHAKHTALDCSSCHESRTSERSSDVLIPGIETCLSCHGAERAGLKTQSSCNSCHLFHRGELGPMKTVNARP